jgi:hypothetical protein
MAGIKVTREGPAIPLPTDLEVSGDVDGDNVDWDTGSGVGPGGGGPGSSNFELNTEGGQSVIKAHGSMGATETIDPTDGNVHTGTLDANVTYTLNAPAGSGASEIEFQRTGSGGPWTETWPGSVTWLGGVAQTPPTTGNTAIAVLRSLDGGTTWLGIPVGTGAVVAALDDLTDVTITTPLSGDRLRYDGSGWVNANLHDEPMIATDGSIQTDGLLNPQMHEVAW